MCVSLPGQICQPYDFEEKLLLNVFISQNSFQLHVFSEHFCFCSNITEQFGVEVLLMCNFFHPRCTVHADVLQ